MNLPGSARCEAPEAEDARGEAAVNERREAEDARGEAAAKMLEAKLA